ncbi:hypothetical protein J6590_079746 [Homalodisca vitripennis]|nr:hypothetical protein J6590_079746 [Homalodisca vitripennis]
MGYRGGLFVMGCTIEIIAFGTVGLFKSFELNCHSLPLPLLMHGAHCDRPSLFVKSKYTQSNGHPPTAAGPAQPRPPRPFCEPSPARSFCEVEIHAIKWTPAHCSRARHSPDHPGLFVNPAQPGLFVKSKYTQSIEHLPTAAGPAQPRPPHPFCEVEIHAIKWTPTNCDRPGLAHPGPVAVGPVLNANKDIEATSSIMFTSI